MSLLSADLAFFLACPFTSFVHFTTVEAFNHSVPHVRRSFLLEFLEVVILLVFGLELLWWRGARKAKSAVTSVVSWSVALAIDPI